MVHVSKLKVVALQRHLTDDNSETVYLYNCHRNVNSYIKYMADVLPLESAGTIGGKFVTVGSFFFVATVLLNGFWHLSQLTVMTCIRIYTEVLATITKDVCTINLYFGQTTVLHLKCTVLAGYILILNLRGTVCGISVPS